MALPTANTPGYGSITRNGRTYVGCDCVIAFILAGERVGLAAGRLKEGLDIVQLTGNASASGGVHRLGAAFDVKQFDTWWTTLWRNMGSSFWPRLDPNPGIPGDLWDGNEHGHGGIDCPHNSLIAYQNVAYRRGYSGLGQGWYKGQYLWGYGSKDAFPYRPPTYRTWREGIAWANAEADRLEKAKKAASSTTKPAVPAPIPPKETSNMPLTLDDIKKVWQTDNIIASPDKEATNPFWTAENYLRETFRLVRASADGDRVRDEAMLTAIKALADSKPGVDGQAVADAVEKAVRDRLAELTFEIVDKG